MKALILVGSGHTNSRCYKIASLIKKNLENNNIDSDLLELKEMIINECLGCEYCLEHQNQCILQDQMQELYFQINKCNILIFVSPVYFSNFPATLKKVIDRCQLYFNLKDKSIIEPKKFLAIHIGGAPNYSDQFKALELSYKVFLPDIRAKLVELIGISNTDKVNPLDDPSTIDKINVGINKLINLEG